MALISMAVMSKMAFICKRVYSGFYPGNLGMESFSYNCENVLLFGNEISRCKLPELGILRDFRLILGKFKLRKGPLFCTWRYMYLDKALLLKITYTDYCRPFPVNNYTPVIYADGYIVFAFPFVC